MRNSLIFKLKGLILKSGDVFYYVLLEYVPELHHTLTRQKRRLNINSEFIPNSEHDKKCIKSNMFAVLGQVQGRGQEGDLHQPLLAVTGDR